MLETFHVDVTFGRHMRTALCGGIALYPFPAQDAPYALCCAASLCPATASPSVASGMGLWGCAFFRAVGGPSTRLLQYLQNKRAASGLNMLNTRVGLNMQ